MCFVYSVITIKGSSNSAGENTCQISTFNCCFARARYRGEGGGVGGWNEDLKI